MTQNQQSHDMVSNKEITTLDEVAFEHEPYQRRYTFHETNNLHSRLTGKQFSTKEQRPFGLFRCPKAMAQCKDTPRIKELKRQKSVPMLAPCKSMVSKNKLDKKLKSRKKLYNAIREYLKDPFAATEANRIRRDSLRARDFRRFTKKPVDVTPVFK